MGFLQGACESVQTEQVQGRLGVWERERDNRFWSEMEVWGGMIWDWNNFQ